MPAHSAIDAWVDWWAFRDGVFCLLNGNCEPAIFNPSWALFPLIPFAFYPPLWTSIAAFLVLALVWWTLGLHRRLWLASVFLLYLNPFAIQMLVNGNVEFVALLGFVMPFPFNVILWAVKPQMTIGLITLELWQSRARIGALVGLVALGGISLLPWNWLAAMLSYTRYALQPGAVNTSLFPIGVAFGLVALVLTLKYQSKAAGMFVGVFLSPAVTQQCWIMAIFGLAMLGWEPLLAGVLGSWLPAYLRTWR
jgi:hypothetical protein